MTLFGILLKIISYFQLTTTEEYQQLYTDVKAWENTAKDDSEEQMKAMYGKLHKGVAFRLISPILYFFAIKEIRNLITGSTENDDPFE